MHRPCLKIATVALAVAALFCAATVRAADAPLIGTWKIANVSNGNENILALFQVEDKDGKPQATILAAPLLGQGVSIENFKSDAKSIQFDLKYTTGTYHVKLYPGKADPVTKVVAVGTMAFTPRAGAAVVASQPSLAQLQKTDEKELTRADAQKATPEAKLLQQARTIRDLKDQQSSLKEIIEKNAGKPVAYASLEILLQSYGRENPKDEEFLGAAEQFLKAAVPFGPDVERHALEVGCKMLAKIEKGSPVAIAFIRKAETGLTKDASTAHSVIVLKSLATALKRSGKTDEAKGLEPRIAKLDLVLDTEYEKTAVPFKVAEFKERVVVVELFTGAYCPPCVAADVAFDAALETYKPKHAVFLQYHTHIPQPDRLTNPDTLARLKFYGKDVRGVPTCFLNGKVVEHEVSIRNMKTMVGLGGPKANGEGSFNILRAQVAGALEKEATAELKLNVERKGDKIDINAEVTELKNPGDKVMLRFVLIQDVVRYPGSNGQRLHHAVVRALPGGADGFALKEEKSKQHATVNLADLRKSLDEYLTDFNKGARKFQDDEEPLTMKNLKVVAFIQNDENKEILQAVQVEVPEGK